MKKKQAVIALVVLLILATIGVIYYQLSAPKDRCTNKDRETNNCVPAGKCGPTPEIDAVIDCGVKNYDKKFNTEL